MSHSLKSFTILMADDDAEDCLLLKDAVSRGGLPHDVRTVPDGEALLDYLAGCGDGVADSALPRPDLILLDLNMPRRDGRETLRLLRQDRQRPRIPIVVLTTSRLEADIRFAYEFGASSYITKPTTFQGWIDMVGTLDNYWFRLVELPRGQDVC